MQANIIPGTQTTQYGIVIIDIKRFYAHAEQTIDLAEERRIWCKKNKR